MPPPGLHRGAPSESVPRCRLLRAAQYRESHSGHDGTSSSSKVLPSRPENYPQIGCGVLRPIRVANAAGTAEVWGFATKLWGFATGQKSRLPVDQWVRQTVPWGFATLLLIEKNQIAFLVAPVAKPHGDKDVKPIYRFRHGNSASVDRGKGQTRGT